MFGRREKPQFFVKTQGFEKRFFLENLVRYFGYDIAYSESVNMKTVRLPIQFVMQQPSYSVSRVKKD
jgi:hypothetical protein